MRLPKTIAAMAVPVVGVALLFTVPASAQAPASSGQPSAEKASSPATHKGNVTQHHHHTKRDHAKHDVSPASKGANIKQQ
jgi:hypothetical protein